MYIERILLVLPKFSEHGYIKNGYNPSLYVQVLGETYTFSRLEAGIKGDSSNKLKAWTQKKLYSTVIFLHPLSC